MRIRLAAWGAAAIAVAAVAYMPGIHRTALHSLLSLAMLAGYLLVSFDPPVRTRRQQQHLIAGIVAGAAGFLIVILLPDEPVLRAIARGLAVAAMALPLWLFARMLERGLFVAGGALAMAAFLIPGGADSATGMLLAFLGYGAVIGAAGMCALRLASPTGTVMPARRPPRMVWGRDVVTLSDTEKAERIAVLDRRLAAGEIPEHVYWDRRQEIESR